MLAEFIFNNFFICIGLPLLFFLISAGYAYRVNAKLAGDNPKKRDYPLLSIFLAPFTWPIFLFLYILLYVLRVFVSGIILILLMASNFFLLFLKKILELIVEQLKGRERLKNIFLRTGLALFILGNLCQLIALLV
jgi:hypothetical protein